MCTRGSPARPAPTRTRSSSCPPTRTRFGPPHRGSPRIRRSARSSAVGETPNRRGGPQLRASSARRREPLMTRFAKHKLLLLAVLLLAAVITAPVARADGDPASDYLISQQTFLSP